MALKYADRVQETTTTTGTGTLTLAGAVAQFQTFAAIGDANTCFYLIEDLDGVSWEVGIGTYTATGTTLSRDTILDNDNGDTSAITLGAGTHNVACVSPAVVATTSGFLGFIQGCVLTFDDAQATAPADLLVTAGDIVINGELVVVPELTGTEFIESDDTGVTLGADDLYYVYIVNDAGTIKALVDIRSSSAKDPTWDDTLKQWSHPDASGFTGGLPTADAAYRLIGLFNTGGDSLPIPFTTAGYKNSRQYHISGNASGDEIRLISSFQTTTETSTDFGADIPTLTGGQAPGDIKLYLKPHAARVTSTGVARFLVAAYSGGSTNNTDLQLSVYTTTSAALAIGWVVMHAVGPTLYYRAFDSESNCFLDYGGCEYYV